MGFVNVADMGERGKTELWGGSPWFCFWTFPEAELGHLEAFFNPWSLGLALGFLPDGESALLAFLCSSSSSLHWPTQEPQGRLLTALWSFSAKRQRRRMQRFYHRYMYTALLRGGYYRNFPKRPLKSEASFSA